jgi:monofunctional biosynthetic peptidoglycan transglycosylase
MAFVKRALRFMRKVLMWFFIISVLCVVVTRFVPVWTTPLMYIRSFESITHGKMPHWEKTWVSLDKISPNAVQAVVASEDNLFLKHWGFSFNDISKALEHNDKGKRVRGGSTISQQTAKNVFLFPQRSYIRKGLEAYFTVLIEAVWGKKRIMEVYLNVIEMGDGVYGIEAAAQKYFHKSADKLTREEAARIAVCLPNPRVYSVAKPSKYIISRQNKIVRLMKLIPKTEFK